MRQRLRRACARVHSQFSIDGYGMSNMQMDQFCVSRLKPQLGKGPLYISLYKQTNLTKDHLHLLWVNANGFQLK